MSLNDNKNPGHEPKTGKQQQHDIQMLVLGVGNDMMGDEGIGARVARQLNNKYVFPEEVEVVDGGVGGMSLLPLIRTADEILIVDAVDASAEPGSIFMFDCQELEVDEAPKLSMHDTGIIEVIRTAALMHEGLCATIIGVQPKQMDEFGAGLSKPVAATISRVIEIIIELLASKGLSPELKQVDSLVNAPERDSDA